MFFFVAYSFIYLFIYLLIKKNYNFKKIDLKVSVV